jgi:DNA adenine methylase Dam
VTDLLAFLSESPDYVQPPFNYTGSKFLLLNQLIPKFDPKPSTFVDLFTGGGAVYTNVIDRYEHVIVNDLIGDLVGAHKALIQDPGFVELVKAFCATALTQNGYNALRAEYNREKSPARLYALMLSCTNNMLRFNLNMGFNQTWGQRSFNSRTQEKITAFRKHLQPHQHKLSYHSLPFDQVPIPEGSMVYMDPPYSGAHNGAGYNTFWGRTQDLTLYDTCMRLNERGDSVGLSNVYRADSDDNPLVVTKLLAEGFHLHVMDYNYGKVARKAKPVTDEVFVCNYEIST